MRSLQPIVILLFLSAAVQADWLEFRGNGANGHAATTGLPTTWSKSRNVVWREELPGDGWSSPTVLGKDIFLTAAIPSDDQSIQLTLLLLDAETGELTRRVPLFTQDVDARIHDKNSHASPTPVIHEGRVYLHFGPHGTACTTLAGEIIWKNQELSYPPVHGNGGSPVATDGVLAFSRDGADISEVTALDLATGRIAWQVGRDVEATKRFSFCTPLVLDTDDRRQLILPGSDVVQSIDLKTGREFWRVTYDGYSVVPRPIMESGMVFVCTGFNRPSLLAIDPTGRGDVTESHVKWSNRTNIPKTPSLVGFDGKVAMVSDNGIASCFDARSGETVWTKRIGGNFSASPIYAEKRLYLMSESGECTVLDVQGDPETIAVNELGERCLASPAVVDNDLLIRTAAALYRIGGRQAP